MIFKKFCLVIILVSLHVCVFPQTFEVMTYNIRFDNPADGINAWPNRKNKVFELLKKYDPEILGVQEALVHQLEEIIAALPDYAYVGVGRDDGKTKGEFSAILYKKNRFTLIENHTFWLSETPEIPGSKNWDAAITRVVTWARFEDVKSKHQFYVLNTHFDHIGQEARRNSASLIIKKAAELSNLPILITGDFNCTRKDPPYQVIINSSKPKLMDPAPANAPGTFCNFGVNSQDCIPIDYIFHSPDWKSSNYKVIPDNDGKNYPSDHLPVCVKVSLR